MFLKIKGTRSIKMITALIVEKTHDREIILSWNDCKAWGIIPAQFPLPMDMHENTEDLPNKTMRTLSNPENLIEEVVDSTRQKNANSLDKQDEKEAEKLKNYFLKKYSEVFRDSLEKGDVIKCTDQDRTKRKSKCKTT